jgi:hypothetical protein
MESFIPPLHDAITLSIDVPLYDKKLRDVLQWQRFPISSKFPTSIYDVSITYLKSLSQVSNMSATSLRHDYYSTNV